MTAVLAVVLVGIAKAGFGGGVGVIATPLLALTIPVTEAAALFLPLLIIIDIFSIYHYRNNFDRPSIRLLLPGALVGIVLGSFFFGYFADNERVLKVGIGVLALLFVLFQASRGLIFGVLNKYRPPTLVGIMAGTTAGFTSTLAHVGAAPASVYLLPQQLPRDIFVGTTVVLFTVVNLVKLVPYGYLGLLKVGNLATIAVLAPLCIIGVRLGIYLNERFNDYYFNWLIYTLLFLTGVQLVVGQNLLTALFE